MEEIYKAIKEQDINTRAKLVALAKYHNEINNNNK